MELGSMRISVSLGCVNSEKEQRDLLELAFDKLLARNAQRAKVGIGGHPLTYEEVRAASPDGGCHEEVCPGDAPDRR